MDDSKLSCSDLLTALSRIVSAHLANNNTTMSAQDVPDFIRQVHLTLAGLDTSAKGDDGQDVAKEALPSPAVPVKDSIRPDHLVCLEDGKKLTTLKRHLRTRYAMTPDDYRRKWGLPRDYPMVAPDYAAYRSSLAQKIGLGAKRRAPVEPVPELVPAQGKRTRRSAAEAPAPAPSKKKRNSVRPTS